MKPYLYILMGLFISTYGNAHENSHDEKQHYKPGADVVFKHNYDGRSEAGENEHIELQFTSRTLANGQLMKIRLNPTDAVEVVEGVEFEATPVDHIVHLPLTLVTKQNGRHYLGVQTEISDAQGHKSFRVFELPIQVGEKVKRYKNKQHKTSYSTKGRKLAILESVETQK